MQPLAERQTCHLRLLINQNARPTLGEFQTTNRRCLSLEPGMRAATVQVDNSRRRFGLRLRSLPEGDQVKELDCYRAAPVSSATSFVSRLSLVNVTMLCLPATVISKLTV